MATPLMDLLYLIQAGLLDYYIPIVFVIGLITNIFNIILFNRRKLRSNCCSRYFICLSISQLFLLIVNCLFRMITSWTKSDGFSTINSLCKIRSYLNILSLVLVRHFICLISIDRWLVTSTNVWLRNKSSLNNVRWIISISLIFWIIFSIHAPISYIIKIGGCTVSSDANYAIFSTIYNITTSCIPFFILIIFSILTLINLQKNARQINRIAPIPPNTDGIINRVQLRQNRRQMDFVRLALFQIIPYLLFNLISSFSTIILYQNSISPDRTTESTAIVSFIHNLGAYLLYLYVSITFIFYTLASNTFRKESILICRKCWLILQRYLYCQYFV